MIPSKPTQLSPSRIIQDGQTPEKFVRDLRRPAMDYTVPTYILDHNFQYVDWNPAFDEIIAKQLGLRLGMHGVILISHLVNCDEVMERSLKVFAAGEHPLIDNEPLFLKTEKYGILRLQKMATQIMDEKGQKKAWMLSLNIEEADNMEQVWKDIMDRIEKEVLWSTLGICSDYLLQKYPDHLKALDLMAQSAQTAGTCLEVGAGSGNLTLRLRQLLNHAEIWTCESNQSLFEIANKKLVQKINAFPEACSKLTFVKNSLDRLDDYSSSSIDAIVSLDGIHRMDSVQRGLEHCHRILKLKGSLSLAFVDKAMDVGRMITSLENHLLALMPQEEFQGSLEAFERCFTKINSELRKESPADIKSLIEKTGFQIESWEETLFERSLIIVRAKKNNP